MSAASFEDQKTQVGAGRASMTPSIRWARSRQASSPLYQVRISTSVRPNAPSMVAQHEVRHGPDRGAEHLLHRGGVADDVDHPEAEDDHERRAPEDAEGLEPRPLEELAPGDRAGEAGRRGTRRRRCERPAAGGRRPARAGVPARAVAVLEDRALRPAPPARGREAEPPDGPGEDRDRRPPSRAGGSTRRTPADRAGPPCSSPPRSSTSSQTRTPPSRTGRGSRRANWFSRSAISDRPTK